MLNPNKIDRRNDKTNYEINSRRFFSGNSSFFFYIRDHHVVLTVTLQTDFTTVIFIRNNNRYWTRLFYTRARSFCSTRIFGALRLKLVEPRTNPGGFARFYFFSFHRRIVNELPKRSPVRVFTLANYSVVAKRVPGTTDTTHTYIRLSHV